MFDKRCEFLRDDDIDELAGKKLANERGIQAQWQRGVWKNTVLQIEGGYMLGQKFIEIMKNT